MPLIRPTTNAPRALGLDRRQARALIGLCVLLAVLAGLRLWPKPPLRAHATYATAFYADDGGLLRLTTARDEQYRVWTRLEDVSPRLVESALLYEDRWYYWHFGVNPVALVRGMVSTLSGGRRIGGSTVTMQLARRVYGIDSRSVPGKLVQSLAAVWIESRYSKHDILEAYLNLAPYGGNVEGVGAASLVFFHKRARELTLQEALTLAVIPQNPSARGGAKVSSATTTGARTRLATSWLQNHPQDGDLLTNLPVTARSPPNLPFRAPHLTNQLMGSRSSDAQVASAAATGDAEVFTSINLRMQSTLERVIAQTIRREDAIGIRNASAMLLDAQSMQVKALVGSANFYDDTINGQVNGALAKRSPGSTLKPFIYALAFDQGVLHPMTVLKDAPTMFGPFSPENFDGRFVGPITAQDALTRSRNVPAVSVAARLTRPTLYDLLQQSGVSRLASEKHYGLALTLGGGEVTMEELAKLYAMLANGGKLQPIRYVSAAGAQGTTLKQPAASNALSAEAAYVTLEMLKTNPRPDSSLPAVPAIAWKTGTSWGFRDAWTAGVFGRYVLVVWIGNFDGTGNPAFIGISAAAPLFLSIVDSLRQEGLVPLDHGGDRPAPDRLTRIEVCAATGDLPNANCPKRVPTWYLPGRSPIRVSTLHRKVLIDTRTNEPTCQEGMHTRWQVREIWSTDMQKIFREAGVPRRGSSNVPDCAQEAARSMTSDYSAGLGQGRVQLVSPHGAASYTQRLSQLLPIQLRAEAERGKLYWFADDAFVGASEAGEALNWTPPKAGRYLIRVVAESGASDSRDVSIEFVP